MIAIIQRIKDLEGKLHLFIASLIICYLNIVFCAAVVKEKLQMKMVKIKTKEILILCLMKKKSKE